MEEVRVSLAMAGFKDGRREQARECRQPLDAGKGKKADSPLDSRKDCSLADTWILTRAQSLPVVSSL